MQEAVDAMWIHMAGFHAMVYMNLLKKRQYYAKITRLYYILANLWLR